MPKLRWHKRGYFNLDGTYTDRFIDANNHTHAVKKAKQECRPFSYLVTRRLAATTDVYAYGRIVAGL